MRKKKEHDHGIRKSGFSAALLVIFTAMAAIKFINIFVYPDSVILPPDFFFAVIIAQLFFLWFYSVKEKHRLVWLQKKRQELADMKSKFTLITSHELMTPITVVKGYMKLMKDKVLGGLTKEQEGALDVMDKYFDRLETIKENLRALSLGNKRSFAENLKKEQVEPIANAVMHDMAPFFRKRRQNASLVIDGKLPEIMIDRIGVRQVLENLIMNAIRFTPDSGMIAVRIKEEAGAVRFEVEDNGIGIPRDKLERIFESFYELQDIKKHSSGSIEFRSGGMGLGLAVAKNIVEAHGGRIWAESEVGKYSRFIFRLPKG
jgi:signal transduction histidine kinase